MIMRKTRFRRVAQFKIISFLLITCQSNYLVDAQSEHVDDFGLDSSDLSNFEIMLRLYDSTLGMRWKDHSNWLNDDICTWKGLTCYGEFETDLNRTGQIKEIDLTENALVGTLPSEIYDLPYLETLVLNDNPDLVVALNNIGNSHSMKYLSLDNTQILLDGIGAATSLQTLDISRSQLLNSSLPEALFSLKKLTSLTANSAKFRGSIPSNISTMTSLEQLILNSNNLSGQLPSELGLMTNIKILTMSGNLFSGTLPKELNECANLERISLERNVQSSIGNSIKGSLPSFSKLSHLTEVNFKNQRLTGSIPHDFMAASPKDETIKIILTNNELTGAIPTSWSSFHRMRPELYDNKIETMDDSLCINEWMGGSVDQFGCNSILCPPNTYSSEGRETSSEECQFCAAAQYFGTRVCLGGTGKSNETNGKTAFFTGESEILELMYQQMGGHDWKDKSGWIQEDDPCLWKGIDCNRDGKVTSISLKNNGLTNKLPNEIFSLPELQILNLNGNNVSIEFTDLLKASKLTSLDLTQTGIVTLDGLEHLKETKIEKLKFGSNGMKGTIPPFLFQLTDLTEINFSHNELTGQLSPDVGLLTNIQRFQLYGNKLSGLLPTELGQMSQLRQLNLAENNFSSTLPTELEQLTLLRSLSIHQTSVENGLFGPLLAFPLASQLTSLNLDSNDLTGELPENFLIGTENGQNRMEVRLSDNNLQGAVPFVWVDRFDDLFIDLTGNFITDIPKELCNKEDWMDASVSEFECEAILCPTGTWNPAGRRTDVDNKCEECSQGANYLGTKKCSNQTNDEDDLSLLKEFYYATGGTSWIQSTGWLQTMNACGEWQGIFCNKNNEITKVDLSNNGLMGTLPSSFFQLSKLTELDLQGNQISITFEGIEKVNNLQSLQLDGVDLSDVNGINKAKNLKRLHLSNNDLTGFIPDELYELTKLTYLNLDNNMMTGRISNNLSKLSGLIELHLNSNKISGQIPAAIKQLSQLETLTLSYNRFSGTLPEELNELFGLKMIAIAGESAFSGTNSQGSSESAQIRSGIRGPLLSFQNQSSLETLYLNGNSFTGSIPSNFLGGLTDVSGDILINLAFNQLSGTIPSSFSRLNNLTIELSGNMITGFTAGFCEKQGWMAGQVKELGCDAILCPPGKYSHLGRASSFSGEKISCDECVVSDATSYWGSVECINNEARQNAERKILKDFFVATGGYDWKNNNNWLHDDLSICTWVGVTCISGKEPFISALSVPSNGLNGTVPKNLFELEGLIDLDFSDNKISIDFENIESSSISTLNIDNTRQTDMTAISKALPYLKVLHASNNKLSQIPEDIFELKYLESLKINQNAFSTKLPTGFEKLQQLHFFECERCGFSGQIPDWISSLEHLEFLSLARNGFTGVLPTELELLSKLTHLDLSKQRSMGSFPGLSGKLLSFSGMEFLSELNLSYNSFTGLIPLTFLEDVVLTQNMIVDLRGNYLTGTIPDSLARLEKIMFMASDNNFDGIAPALCPMPWNDHQPHADNCDHILCPNGTYNALGYAMPSKPCLECKANGSTTYFGSTECGENDERGILRRFYEELNGQNWKSNDGWLDEDDVCNWFGIQCHEDYLKNGRVKQINLASNNLKGSLPTDIYRLQDIESLILNQNNVTVSFEGIRNALNLKNLYLSQTRITSLAGISNADLVNLHLTSCNLAGTLPLEIFYLSNLQGLFLNYNNFEGELYTHIGRLTNLKALYLFNNKLTGSIPSEIGLLSAMTTLGLGGNQLGGRLPSELNKMTKLEILSLQQESGFWNVDVTILDGGIDVGLGGTLPSFEDFTNLSELYLGKNSFQGTIPSNFLSGIKDVSRIIKVDISNNKLVGSIPEALSRFDDLRLFLAGNGIQHVPEAICEKHKWMNGLMSTGCDALLCLPGSYSEFGRRISAEHACQPCAFNTSFSIYGSQFCSLEEETYILDERSILSRLFQKLNGEKWIENGSWLDKEKPICSWEGVYCNSGGSVIKLDLQSNGLQGTIPSIIYRLPSLEILNARKNDVVLSFHGAEAGKSLKELYLDETNISSLRGIGKLSLLKVLHAEKNNFGGQGIPDDLFSLSNLERIYLSNSGLAGKLPEKLGQLKKLKEVHAHWNDFTGTLPTTLGTLDQIEIINLSENLLIGQLPKEMNHMRNLKSFLIDSSTRKSPGLTGKLLSFSGLAHLEILSLASNTITGTIPPNFLSSTKHANTSVSIDLRDNELSGTVPTTLKALDALEIYLTGNNFQEIDQSLCQEKDWMNGAVGKYGCDAIMCNLGFFNKNGRQTEASDPCIKCEYENQIKYMGSTSCVSMQREKERTILELFYRDTGGKEWKKNDGWMKEDVDICKWYGISCNSDGIVESIMLGANNLRGKPPKEIFELTGLQLLLLRSNPMDFSFDNIMKAKSLTSLLLDATHVRSIEGIGNAPVLSEIDLQFNSLTGTLPEELYNLHELKSFSIGHNQLTGMVPTFTNNRKLSTLRLESNSFSGDLPDFSTHPKLATLDLSDNRIRGTIPNTMLQSTEAEKNVFLDFSVNSLSGTVPASLFDKFDDLTIYLRDNQLESVDKELCFASRYNEGDVAVYGCNGILCPVGTYQPVFGRASQKGGECIACPQATYMGSTTCKQSSASIKTKLYFVPISILLLLLN